MLKKVWLLVLICFSLTGCNVDPLLLANLGFYRGSTSKGDPCAVAISAMELPLLGLIQLEVQVKGFQDESNSRFTFFGRLPDPIKVSYVEGTHDNPTRLFIESILDVRLSDKKIASVSVLATGETCKDLTREFGP